ncbi:MAG: (2Fe-2S)-binding protein [Propionibacteriaceae bacterium]|jgi:carbon-monoxide dehydrogenase small subunit|nr:(2Fe-2S)-binding protein [Propionibacteriaceae bacterium]
MSLMTEQLVTITATVNGDQVTMHVPAHRTLLEALRDLMGLTGTKSCCTEGECGACTVLLNGLTACSCLVLAAEVDGAEIVTIEGLAALDLQENFVAKGAVQCGFCTPGQIVSAHALLAQNPNPSEQDIREHMSGNLCRCGSYKRIIEAIQTTAEGRRNA